MDRKVMAMITATIFLFIAGCSIKGSAITDFKEAYKNVVKIDEKYDIPLDSYPANFQDITIDWPLKQEQIPELRQDLLNLKQHSQNQAMVAFLDFRLVFLDAEEYYKQGLGYGKRGEVLDGFKCSDKPFIIDAANYAVLCARAGYESVNLLQQFLVGYPKEAEETRISGAWPMLLNESFKAIERRALSNIGFVNNACKD